MFFREFRYTLEDLPKEGNFSLLSTILSRGSIDPDDEERLKIISLSLEATHPDEDLAQIQKASADLLKNLHKDLLIAEKNRALARGEDILTLNQTLIPKALALGLPPSVLR